LIVTSEWPGPDTKDSVPFLVQFVKSLKSKGINVSVFHFRGGSISKRLISFCKLRFIYLFNNWDLIHCHWGQNTIFAYTPFIPIITTFHGSDLQGGDLSNDYKYKIDGKIYMVLSQIAYFMSSYNIFVSKILKEKIFIRKDNSCIIPMGVDLKKFKYIEKRDCRTKLNLPMNKKLILFGGNYKKKIKRHSIAVEVVKILGNDYQLISLYLNDFNQMPLYMNACDVLLMTSKHEGSPMMVKEALACKMSIVSTDVGDVRDQIMNIKGSYITRSENPKIIAKYVEKCFSELKHSKRIPTSPKIKNYELDYTVDKNIDIYKKVLKL
tara:strand:+ start:1017 stop:1985 length:969 start_codon:yes stop_codon:yes gene_type:complete